MYVFSRLTRHKPSVACGYLLPQCADSTDPEGAAWIVTLPPKPKNSPRKSRPTRYSSRSNAKDLRVLQLTDIHVDFQYVPGSEAQCSMPVCCRDNSSKPTQKAGYWGTAADCDIPPWTVEHMLQHTSQNHQIDAIILTGDYINHVDWQYSEDEHLVVLRKLQNLIVKYFPSTPTYWSLGNHEGVPVNSFAPHFVEERFWPTWLYNQLKNMSSPWVEGNVTNRQISNFLYLNQSDPDGTMSWLVRELYASEKSGDAVHIMAHIPPGDGECLEGWARNYYRVVQRFADTITAQYFGHDHNDFFIVFYENMDDVNSRPVSVGYAAPSVTTYSNLNPAYRIYTLDASNRYTPSNFEVYTTDLYKYPTANDSPEWSQLYSAKEEYGLPDLSPNSWNKLINQLYTETSTRNTFTKNSFRSATPACDAGCVQGLLCSLRMGHHNESLYCSPPKAHLLTNRVP
ncbi:hypothetical protein WR25_03763 [Diploscapter pachys]|uniref:Calcineurin-like phosphoesterase domain-containing protein n=1 Tax=Diploscapter pachys TaxID=2018661 RepID=A0A2A2LP21_9BILA|nr:hypothetical protein WR25_03763 [Diploscapter pachys]